jgi:hypothetical protein
LFFNIAKISWTISLNCKDKAMNTHENIRKKLRIWGFYKIQSNVKHKREKNTKLIKSSKKTNATLKGQKRKGNPNSLTFTKSWFVSSCTRYEKIDEAHKQLYEKKPSKVEKWKGQTHEGYVCICCWNISLILKLKM